MKGFNNIKIDYEICHALAIFDGESREETVRKGRKHEKRWKGESGTEAKKYQQRD
jgi:hypothetical protein